MGRTGALALIDRLDGVDAPPVQVLIPLDLHEGDSTAAPRS
jgi:DNA-binding LacI/PurR family transcriptional regulator